MIKRFVTSESVNIGHPDKTCDTIADAILDEAIRQDPNSQMAVECAIKNDKLFLYGEATTKANLDYDEIAQNVLKDIGYKNRFKIIKEISTQSPDINQAVVKDDLCANDQGVIFGYATNETKEYMPLPIMIAHKLMKQYDEFRRHTNCYFADAKSQVTVEYHNDKPYRIDTIILSVSHSDRLRIQDIRRDMRLHVLRKVLAEYSQYVTPETKYLINTSGRFVLWGSFADSGCVGRKIIVDSYGGVGRSGGGCFSSKNATKVDRSGAYYARYVAKNIVAHGYADRCEVSVCYAIGQKDPIKVDIETFGTNHKTPSEIRKYVAKNFDFSVSNMIKELDLLRPIYKQTACYGHFGRDEFSWEKIKD